MAYANGQPVILTVKVRNRGVLGDPTTLRLRVKPPGEAWAEYTYGVDSELVKIADGHFEGTIDTETDRGGMWRYEWKSTGPKGTSGVLTFSVDPPPTDA